MYIFACGNIIYQFCNYYYYFQLDLSTKNPENNTLLICAEIVTFSVMVN